MAQSGYGEIRLFHDFTGPELQDGPEVHHAATAGALWNIGNGFTIKGDALNDAEALATSVEDGLNGQITLTSANVASGDSIYVTTETCFKPSVNAPMAVEVRCEMASLDDRTIFIGFSGTMDDAQSTICSGSTETITLTESNLVGFLYDSGLTTDIDWHTVYNGGTATGETVSTSIDSGITPVVNTMDILRVEVDPNGTARWWINGVLKKTLANAVSTTAVFAACAGATATTTTSATVTVDYIAVEANRDWTI